MKLSRQFTLQPQVLKTSMRMMFPEDSMGLMRINLMWYVHSQERSRQSSMRRLVVSGSLQVYGICHRDFRCVKFAWRLPVYTILHEDYRCMQFCMKITGVWNLHGDYRRMKFAWRLSVYEICIEIVGVLIVC